MKTLNRTLSLTLVFALVFSLMSFAFSAETTATTTTKAPKLSDFTDADKLTYTEAADYLIAAGVVKGETATTLNPKGDFTRAQAAKLIAYAALGQTAADNLKVSVSPFKDVDASNWAAGYIAYCQKQGFVNGYGDGNFGPNDKVTGYQMAKMLLCSLGYGVNSEFTGSGWELAVAPLALSYGIFTDNAAGASAVAATREEAFLYTYNTLGKLCNVSYNKNLGVYYVPGREAIATNPGSVKADRTDTLGYQRFKMASTSGSSTYTEPTHYWTINGKKVTATYSNDPIVTLASSASGSTYEKLTVKGNAEYIGFSKDTTVSYYVNGDDSTLAAVTAAATKRGNVINFIDTDKNGKYDVVEALTYSVVKLSAAPSVKTAGGNSVVTIGEMGMKDIVDDNITGDYASLKKDDYVLYYSNAKKTDWTIAKCATVTGQLYGFNDAANVLGLNVNGTTYYYTGIPTPMTFSEITDTKGLAGTTFYLDAGKNIVAAVPTQDIIAAGNVVFVLDSDDYVGTCTAKLLKSDGTTVTKTITKVVSTNNVATAATKGNVAKDSFFTFTENTDGSYVLKVIDSALIVSNGANDYADTNKVFTKGEAEFFYSATNNANKLATRGTNKTAFVLEGNGSSKLTYKAYTGVSNIPSVTAYDYDASGSYVAATDGAKAYVLNDKDGYAIMAVARQGKLDNSVTALDYVFVGSTASTVTKTSNATEDYYTYSIATVNGALKAFDSTSNLKLTPGLYAVSAYENGKVDHVLTSPADNAVIVDSRLNTPINGKNATKFVVNGNTVTYSGANAGSFVVTNDVKVFSYDTTDAALGKVTLTASSLGAMENLNGATYTLAGLRVSDKDNTINELYVIINPKNSNPSAIDADDYAVTRSGLQISGVKYYTTAAHDDLDLIEVIKANLVANGYTVTKVAFDGTDTYTLSTTKSSIAFDFTWKNTAKTESVKVKVDGTDKLLDKTTKTNALGGTGTFAKQTTAAGVTSYVAIDGSTGIIDGATYETGFYKVTYAAPTLISFADTAAAWTVDGTTVTADTYAKTGAKVVCTVTTGTTGFTAATTTSTLVGSAGAVAAIKSAYTTDTAATAATTTVTFTNNKTYKSGASTFTWTVATADLAPTVIATNS